MCIKYGIRCSCKVSNGKVGWNQEFLFFTLRRKTKCILYTNIGTYQTISVVFVFMEGKIIEPLVHEYSELSIFQQAKIWTLFTAKRKLERLQFSTSSSFVKIWNACNCEFKAYFWIFWALYHLLFDLETIRDN